MPDLVALPLSNPLMPEQAKRVGAADVRMYKPGDTIIVPKSGAMTIIRAGWGQCDPNDPAAVAATLAAGAAAAAADAPAGASPPAAVPPAAAAGPAAPPPAAADGILPDAGD